MKGKEEKDFEKIKERMKKYTSGDGDELLYNPMEKRTRSLLSLRKPRDMRSAMVSSKQTIGKITNKNIHKRYDSVDKMLRRIEKNRERL